MFSEFFFSLFFFFTAFVGLDNLKVLNLTKNSLQILTGNYLQPLKSLESLFLDDNMIHVIDDNFFAGLKSLKLLSLTGNRMAKGHFK